MSDLHEVQARDEVEPHDELSRRLTRALEAVPAFTVPAGFAARTAAAAARLAPAPAPARCAALVARFAFAILTLAMLLLIPQARDRANYTLALETLLSLEFVGLTMWFSLRPPLSR
jgi:hypothetical protein